VCLSFFHSDFCVSVCALHVFCRCLVCDPLLHTSIRFCLHEAAVKFLCSVPYFTQVRVKRYPKRRLERVEEGRRMGSTFPGRFLLFVERARTYQIHHSEKKGTRGPYAYETRPLGRHFWLLFRASNLVLCSALLHSISGPLFHSSCHRKNILGLPLAHPPNTQRHMPHSSLSSHPLCVVHHAPLSTDTPTL